MRIKKISIFPGHNKQDKKESFEKIEILTGQKKRNVRPTR